MTTMLIAALWAQAAMQAPRAGCSLTASGEFRAIIGIAGNFIASEASHAGVRAAACSGELTVLDDGHEFLVVAGNEIAARRPTRGGERSLLSVSRTSAGIWEPGWLHLWAHSRWATLPVSGDWRGFAIGDRDAIAVTDDSIVRIDRASGAVLSEVRLEGLVSAAFVWEDGAALLRVRERVVFRAADGTVKQVDLAADTFGRMSDEWIEARGAEGNFAIRRQGERLEWFALP